MRIKRLMASLSANFESFVAKMENHDAVAQVAIADVQKAAARLRAEKNKVDQRIHRLTEEKSQQEENVARWKARAKSCVAADESKAMQCLRQATLIEKQLQQTLQHRDAMQCLANTLAGNLREVENKLDELNTKRSLLVSREARAKVHNSANRQMDSLDVDDVFARWEQNIMESEYREGSAFFAGQSSAQDVELAQEFESQEAEKVLREQLQALKTEVRDNNDKTL